MFKSILKTVRAEKTKSKLSEQHDHEDIPQVQPQPSAIGFTTLTLSLTSLGPIRDVFYVRDIVSESEADHLWNCIYEQKERWNKLQYAKRRVQRYGGDVTPQGLVNVEPLPPFLVQLAQAKLSNYFDMPINHALINEYETGVGIMNHFDGPLYYNFVNIISLGSSCLLKFTRNDEHIKLFVEPKSLLAFSKEAYIEWHHGIDYVDEDVVLLKICDAKVVQADVVNYALTEIAKVVALHLPNYLHEELSISDNDGRDIGVLVPVKNNPIYTDALIVKRSTRVSVTLRHVYPQ